MKKKVLGALLTACMLLQSTSVLAAGGTTQSVSSAGTQTCTVDMTVDSTFSVTIPKSIVLDGSTGAGSYTVKCTGSLGYKDCIKVVPDATFNMSDGSTNTIKATVTQNKTGFVRADRTPSNVQEKVGTDITGSIASTPQPGIWNGTFNFTISTEKLTN